MEVRAAFVQAAAVTRARRGGGGAGPAAGATTSARKRRGVRKRLIPLRLVDKVRFSVNSCLRICLWIRSAVVGARLCQLPALLPGQSAPNGQASHALRRDELSNFLLANLLL